MQRGPLALFGAIVAVGIGPALWLGAQLGRMDLSPEQPPAITSVVKPENTPGGVGAADDETITRVTTAEPVSTRTAPRPPGRKVESVAEVDTEPPAPVPPSSAAVTPSPTRPPTSSASPLKESTPPTPGVTPSVTATPESSTVAS